MCMCIYMDFGYFCCCCRRCRECTISLMRIWVLYIFIFVLALWFCKMKERHHKFIKFALPLPLPLRLRLCMRTCSSACYLRVLIVHIQSVQVANITHSLYYYYSDKFLRIPDDRVIVLSDNQTSWLCCHVESNHSESASLIGAHIQHTYIYYSDTKIAQMFLFFFQAIDEMCTYKR